MPETQTLVRHQDLISIKIEVNYDAVLKFGISVRFKFFKNGG